MENKKETAVEWLLKELKNYDSKMIELFDKEIKQAKEMEKQQIIDAYNTGYVDGQIFAHTYKNRRKDAEEYYNETFKQ